MERLSGRAPRDPGRGSHPIGQKAILTDRFQGWQPLGAREAFLADRCVVLAVWDARHRFLQCMMDVRLPFTQFYQENRFWTPSSNRFIFVLFLEFLNENDVFGVLAISNQKSIFIVPANAKSFFRKKNVKFQEATSLEPVQSRSTLRPQFDPPKGVEKCSAAAQVRVKSLLEICHFSKT